MRKLYSTIFAMIAVIFVSTCVLLILSPDEVPVHYNFAGQVNRIGSKYEFLIFPAEAIGIGLFFTWMANRHCKDRTEEKALLITGISILGLLGFLGVYFQIEGILYNPSAIAPMKLRVVQITFTIAGVLFIILGNMLPKAQRNTLYGLRTKWSLSSDTVWQRSQRFAGISMVICGVIMVLCCLVENAMLCMILCTVLTLLWGIAGAVMSYVFYKEENGK